MDYCWLKKPLYILFLMVVMKLLSSIKKFIPFKKHYTLVISWWGMRWFYAVGVLKWLEECWLKQSISAIYGVSAWAIVASYRAAGYTAEQIYDIFMHHNSFGLSSINLLTKQSLLKLNSFEKMFYKDLPKDFSDLQIKTYIWTTDINKGTFRIFDKGSIVPALLWSVSIPGVFPVVHYQNHVLMDGWATNNFPVDVAKKRYPKNEIIGIALNNYKEHQTIKNIFDTLSVSFEILLRNHTIENMGIVDHLLYTDIPLKVLDTNKKNMQKAYVQGYQDCIAHFRN